jgi:hypothetical protein
MFPGFPLPQIAERARLVVLGAEGVVTIRQSMSAGELVNRGSKLFLVHEELRILMHLLKMGLKAGSGRLKLLCSFNPER